MKKFILLFLSILFIPVVYAEEECGLLNLASCIPQKIYDFFLNLINAPLIPLLNLVKSLLTEPVDISLFGSIWAIMLYIISLFYGLLMLYSGFNFMTAGYDSARRANAKEWFRNILIMMVLVQASYYLYSLIIDLSSLLTAGVMGLINQQFFLITADNLTNIGLEFFFILFYALTLLFTVIILALRYIFVGVGLIFAPLAIFFYFIPPLRGYGKLIMNFFGNCIFITFFDALILLVCAKLVEIPLFATIKILVMISAFSIVNIMMFYFMFFSAIKSAANTASSTAGTVKTIVSVVKYFA